MMIILKEKSVKFGMIRLFKLAIFIGVMMSFFMLGKIETSHSKIDLEHFVLDNGLEVIIIPNHRVPAVMHMVWYKVGAIDELPGKTGLAHYLEHLMFHGTKKYPKDEMDKLLSSFGGSHNAFTSYDFTGYYQSVPKQYLARVMDMESDRMRNLILDSKQVEIEKSIVLEERLLRRDNSPRSLLMDKLREGLFGKDHPYARPIIGYEEDIKALTHQDALNFYQKYYHPNNAILLLAGDITKLEAMPLIEQYYAGLPRGEASDRAIANSVSQVKEKIVKHYDKNTNNVTVTFSYLAPDLMSQEKAYTYPLSLISYMLASNQNSILHKRLVLAEDLAIGVSSEYSDMSRGQSEFSISVMLKKPEFEEKVKAIIAEELGKIKSGEIDMNYLKRAKNLFLIESIYDKESYKSLAYIIGMNYTSGISLEEIQNFDDEIVKVSVSDLKEAANFVFQEDKLAIGYLFPEKTDLN